MDFNEIKTWRRISDKGYWKIMTSVSSTKPEKCEIYKGHLSKTQKTPDLQRPWAQCKSGRSTLSVNGI